MIKQRFVLSLTKSIIHPNQHCPTPVLTNLSNMSNSFTISLIAVLWTGIGIPDIEGHHYQLRFRIVFL